MRSSGKLKTRTVSASVLALTAAFALPGAFAQSQSTASAPAPGTKIYSPYVDLGLTSSENLASTQKTAGLKGVTLAFIVSTGSGCSAGWGGLAQTLPKDNFPNGSTVQSLVKNLQKANVQVIVSFGGQSGIEPAVKCTSVSKLQALYQSVITRYGVKMLDFDVEGSEAANTRANTNRAKALVALKKANPGLYISYTLPVVPTGLLSSGVSILKNAKSAGLSIDLVNIMAMDYGSSIDNHGQMGTDAVDAAEKTESQIKSAGLSSKVGVTTMIGVNDTKPEVFKLNDVNTVLNFAKDHSYVGRLGIWSIARDNGSCAGNRTAQATCSGLSQSNYQFSENFKTF